MPQILIIDDHPLFVEGLENLIRKAKPTIKTHHANHLEPAKNYLKSDPSIPLILLDRTLPGVDSLEHIAEFRTISPQLRIAIISGSSSQQHMNEVIEAGLAGFIPKSLSPEQTLMAIDLLLKGNVFFPKELLQTYRQPKKAMLTTRQIEILSLAAVGQSNKKIAQSLGLTEGTVKQHFTHILKELPAENRVHAIRVARARGLIG